jgi:subtilisin-like proprotein convertase family protein
MGGDIDVTNVTIKLDDAALNSLPNNGPLVSGTFRPTNDDTTTDVFPAPAPVAPYDDTLSDFNGQSPNGTWSLYIRDDTASDSGLVVEGWSLGITTQPIIIGLDNVSSPEDRAVTDDFTVAEESFATTDFTFTATSSNPSVVPSSTNNIVFGGSGTNRTITIIPASNASGSSTITVTLRNADGQQVSDSLVATFTAVNDAPTVTQVPNQVVPLGGETVVTNFFFSDVETERSFLRLDRFSSNEDVMPTNNIVIVGDEIRLIAGGTPGRSTVTITVSDPSGASASTTFEVVVAAGANPVFTQRDGITIRDNNTALPYPSTNRVSDVAGTITKVTVTLNGFRHTYPDDVDILLVGPGGQSVVLLSDAGTGGDNTPAELENARFVFDDAGGLPADNAALPESATFRPSNFEGNETFPAPAPGLPYGTALSVFNGTNPNGDWLLYVADDASPDAGSIESWTLTFTTTAPTITQIPSPVIVREDNPTNILFQVNAPGTDPTNLVVNARIDGTPIISLAVTGTGSDRTLTITPRANQTGTNVVTLTVSDQTGANTNTASTTFTVIVQNVDNDAPVVGPIPDMEADPGETLVVTVPVTDPDTALGDMTFIAGAAGTNIVQSIRIDPGTNANTVVATIEIFPNANGTETITISAFDGENLSRATFEVDVTGNRAPVIEPIADVSTPEDVSPTVRINVSDAETPLAQLTITGQAANTNLVSGISIANNGTTVQATINLVPNASGTSPITISANDGTNTTTSTFTLTVIAVPECPTLGAIADQSGAAGTTIRVPLNVADQDTALTDLTFLGGAGGTAVVQSITFDQTATSVTAVITLQAGATGSDTVTIRVLDGECAPVTQSFTLRVGDVTPPAATLGITRGTNTITLTITGQAGATYAIEATTDFLTWTQIGTVTIDSNGTATLTIPSTGPHRFFRTRGGAAPAPAQAAIYEGFGYPAGTLISTNTSGGTGWAPGGWTPDVETPTNHIVLSPGLEYSDATGRGLITTPGSVLYTATTNNMASGDVRSFRTFAGGVQSTGTTWISFIGQRLGPAITNTATPNNIFPRAANLSFYEGGTERFAVGNGSGAPSNLWSVLPAGSVGNVTNEQRSATPMNQQAFIVIRIDHAPGAATNLDNLYMWVNPALGSEPSTATASASSIGRFNFAIDRVRPFAGGNDAGNNRPYAELALDELRVGSSFAEVAPSVLDLTQPFNAIQLVNGTNDGDTAGGAPPANEGVERVIDNVGQKYLNFLDLDSGFIVTPLGSTVVNALRFWPANDAVERDPTSYRLEGSTAGPAGPWTEISTGPLNLPLARNAGGATTALRGGTQELIRFNNTTPYTSYRVTFPTIRNAGTANSMQIAEVDFHFIP